MNIVSIAGMQGMTAMYNSEYSASKAAVSSFADSLRQEILFKGIPIHVMNVYPYIIDTTLFAGFSGRALNLIPTLRVEDAAVEVVDSIYKDKLEVYIPWYSYWLGVGMIILRGISEHLRIKIIQLLMGDGMTTL